jgi:SAM-dependent methyltransferase
VPDQLEALAEAVPSARTLACCVSCGRGLLGRDECGGCGRRHPEVDGILHAIDPLSGTNRIAADFYDGPNWPRFRPWEQLFLWFQGPGVAAARRQVLRHLPTTSNARVLEVGIGDGENLRLLPRSWEVYGVDLALGRLSACRTRHPRVAGRLAWAEAEALPFPEGTFDAVLSVGGFNYFRDHRRALAEMRRVARRGAPVVVADEIPDLYRFAPGHALGFDPLDRWGLRLLGLDRGFVEMVLGCRLNEQAVARDVLPHVRRYPIWNRLGYCLVDLDP